jgi:acetyltransferase-like isoleucine patch superfamily enzyme
MAKGYFFLARSLAVGKITNKVLDSLAFLDYRLLMLLSMWHPDIDSRRKLLRKRGVNVPDSAFIDLGVLIEMTTPQSVIIEEYARLAFGAVVYAHDAAYNSAADLPLRVKTTRIGYNAAVGARSIIMPGVDVGNHSGCLAGSVVTKDIPSGMIMAGNPAEIIGKVEDFGLALQADLKVNPDIYYDHPNPYRAPSTPYDYLITWRKEGVKIQDYTVLRTGTPFDYVLDAKAMKAGKR